MATAVSPYAGSMITQTHPLRILLVDDSPTVRQALRWLLEDTPGFSVVGEAKDGETAVQLTVDLLPDILILDIDLPQKNGFRVARLLRQLAPTVRIVILSGFGDARTRHLACQMGADGFVEKSEGWEALLAQIGRVIGSKSVNNMNPQMTQLRAEAHKESASSVKSMEKSRSKTE